MFKYFKKIYYLIFFVFIYFIINYYSKFFIINHNKLNNNIIDLIYKRNLNILNKTHIYNKKIVIYSALLGNYDTLNPVQKQNQFEFFLFTNNIIKKKTNWTLLKIPSFVNNLNVNIVKKQRFINLFSSIIKNYNIYNIY